MPRPSWWAVASSTTGPVVLIGGFAVAAARQQRDYNAMSGTISALAARDADDRWIMTSCLATLGACHVVTAAGLRDARALGRILLAVGGVATIAVAAFPNRGEEPSTAHTLAATKAFFALALWPALAARRDHEIPALTPGASVVASITLLGLVGWFGRAFRGERRGLAERIAASAQAIWPCIVVANARSHRRGLEEMPAASRY